MGIEMNNRVFLLMLAMSFPCYSLSFMQDEYKVNVIDNAGTINAAVCTKNNCIDNSTVFSNLEPEGIYLDDLNSDGINEIEVEVKGSPSSVIYVYHLHGDRIIPFTDSTGKQIFFSTKKIKNGLLITKIDASPSSESYIYKISKEHTLLPIIKDECIDCGEIKRTDLITKETFLVTDETDFFLRKPIYKKVVVDKAYLLNEMGGRAKGYLIKNDECKILKYLPENGLTYILYEKGHIKSFVKTADLQ